MLLETDCFDIRSEFDKRATGYRALRFDRITGITYHGQSLCVRSVAELEATLHGGELFVSQDSSGAYWKEEGAVL